jgi:hypothetical protein
MTNESSSEVSVSPLDGADAERYVQAVLASADYEQFRNELGQEKGQTFTPQEREATALRIESGLEQEVSVHVPISGGAGQSFYGAILDPDTAAVRRTVSGVFDWTSEDTIAALVKRDGAVVLEAVMTPEGHVVSGTNVTMGVIDCVNDCLDEAEINRLLIATIIAVCGPVCTVTVGTGCIACIASLIGTVSGTLLGCLRRCA